MHWSKAYIVESLQHTLLTTCCIEVGFSNIFILGFSDTGFSDTGFSNTFVIFSDLCWVSAFNIIGIVVDESGVV